MAVVTCDLRLSVSHSCIVIHVNDSQIGMWVLCSGVAERWGKGFGEGEFGSGRVDKSPRASLGPLTRRRAMSQSYRRHLLAVSF